MRAMAGILKDFTGGGRLRRRLFSGPRLESRCLNLEGGGEAQYHHGRRQINVISAPAATAAPMAPIPTPPATISPSLGGRPNEQSRSAPNSVVDFVATLAASIPYVSRL